MKEAEAEYFLENPENPVEYYCQIEPENGEQNTLLFLKTYQENVELRQSMTEKIQIQAIMQNIKNESILTACSYTIFDIFQNERISYEQKVNTANVYLAFISEITSDPQSYTIFSNANIWNAISITIEYLTNDAAISFKTIIERVLTHELEIKAHIDLIFDLYLKISNHFNLAIDPSILENIKKIDILQVVIDNYQIIDPDWAVPFLLSQVSTRTFDFQFFVSRISVKFSSTSTLGYLFNEMHITEFEMDCCTFIDLSQTIFSKCFDPFKLFSIEALESYIELIVNFATPRQFYIFMHELIELKTTKECTILNNLKREDIEKIKSKAGLYSSNIILLELNKLLE